MPHNPSFAKRLIEWHKQHGREDLPWQRNPTPYRVWVSEIMLQQTQVQTVIPYYRRFIRRFNSIKKLAEADTDEVLSLWSGLGYYSRAHSLHKAARMVRRDYGGRIPRAEDELIKLPGIGRSTAGAILSLACGQRHAILDANVRRVLVRHADVAGWHGDNQVKQTLWELSEQRLPQHEVGRYNQALMDMGALVCTVSKPKCPTCPIMRDCQAYRHDTVGLRPARRSRQERPVRKFIASIIAHEQAVLLIRRPPRGIWGGLLSFPEADSVRQAKNWCLRRCGSVLHSEVWPEITYDLTHLRMSVTPVLLELDAVPLSVADDEHFIWCKIDAIPGGTSALTKRLLMQLKVDHSMENEQCEQLNV